MSSVLVLNSGSITQNAASWFRAELARERYGDNVHIFDGERLSQLDRQVAFQHRELLVPRLIGLNTNLKLNQVVWASIKKSLPSFSEGRGCFTQALEDFLSAPFLTTYLDSKEITTLLQECRIIDAINQRYLAGTRVKEGLKEQEAETMRSLIEKATVRALALQSSIQRCLTTFRPVSG